MDIGSNTLLADHIDVYEGPAQSLVTPTLRSLLGNSNRPVTTIDPGYNRSINAFDVGEQYSMYGWAFPVAPGNQGIRERLYAVGTVAGLNPLRLQRPRQQHRDRPPRLGEHQHDASDPRLVVVRQEGGLRLHDAHGSHAQEPGPVPTGHLKKIPLSQFVP